MPRLLDLIATLLLLLLLPFLGLWLLFHPELRDPWARRLTLKMPPATAKPTLWLHGASQGEIRSLRPLIDQLLADPEGIDLLVTAFRTPALEAIPQHPRIRATLIPWDAPWLHRRLLRRCRVQAVAVSEGEFWPGLLAACSATPLGWLSARISPRSASRMARLKPLLRPLLTAIDRVGAQSQEHAKRLQNLGIAPERIKVTGRPKFDIHPPQPDPQTLARLRAWATSLRLIVAGSTHPGEETAALAAWHMLQDPRPKLALVPRHLERLDEVERLLHEGGESWARWSTLAEHPEAEVVLVDRMGLLAPLFAAADAAFLGGSLAPVGGPNVLEPVAAGVAVAVGPHTATVAEEVAALTPCHAVVVVHDADELGKAWTHMLAEGTPEKNIRRTRAASWIAAQRGATERHATLVRELLGKR